MHGGSLAGFSAAVAAAKENATACPLELANCSLLQLGGQATSAGVSELDRTLHPRAFEFQLSGVRPPIHYETCTDVQHHAELLARAAAARAAQLPYLLGLAVLISSHGTAGIGFGAYGSIVGWQPSNILRPCQFMCLRGASVPSLHLRRYNEHLAMRLGVSATVCPGPSRWRPS